MSKKDPEWMYELWERVLGSKDEKALAEVRRKVEDYRNNQFTMEQEVIKIISTKTPFEHPIEQMGVVDEFFMNESLKLKSPQMYQREVCIMFLQELMKAGFDIVEKEKKTNLKGWLNKKDDKWYVKWSDLHSFGHGDHWMYTELQTDQQNLETLLEGAEVEFKLLTDGYNENNGINFKSAIVKTNL